MKQVGKMVVMTTKEFTEDTKKKEKMIDLLTKYQRLINELQAENQKLKNENSNLILSNRVREIDTFESFIKGLEV